MIYTDVVIIGTGDIALKHATIIKKLYPRFNITLYNYRSRKFNKNKITDKIILSTFNNITTDHCDISSNDKKSFAIIASPPSHHVKHSLLFAKKKFHIFCEKPLTDKINSLKNLNQLLEKNNLISHVGYNMRFLESMKFLKNIIDKKIYGKILQSNISVFTNFISWRPDRNYTNTSTASKSLGGGVINELSHEIDYMYYLFGKPISQKSNAHKNKYSSLDVMDSCYARFIYPTFKVDTTIDMLASINKRICHITFQRARVLLNFNSNTMYIFKNNSRHEIHLFKKGIIDTYIDQIKYFIKKIENKIKNDTDIHNYKTLSECLSIMNINK